MRTKDLGLKVHRAGLEHLGVRGGKIVRTPLHRIFEFSVAGRLSPEQKKKKVGAGRTEK